MAPIYEEHDALILSAAQGILRKAADSGPELVAGRDLADVYRIARCIEAAHHASEAVQSALVAAMVRADDANATAALRGRVEPQSIRAARP